MHCSVLFFTEHSLLKYKHVQTLTHELSFRSRFFFRSIAQLYKRTLSKALEALHWVICETTWKSFYMDYSTRDPGNQPEEQQSFGTRPPSCSSLHRTPRASCRPRCWLCARPYRGTHAEGNPTCSAGLQKRRRNKWFIQCALDTDLPAIVKRLTSRQRLKRYSLKRKPEAVIIS